MAENNDAKAEGVSLQLCLEKLHFPMASKLSEVTHPWLSTAFAGWICEAKSVS